MTDKDRKQMEELGEAICPYCPWTNFGKTSVDTVSCARCRCETSYKNYLEDCVVNKSEEPNWRNDYQKWVDGGRK